MFEIEFYEEARHIMTTWKELRSELKLSAEEENAIELEKGLIRTMVKIREEQGLSQAELAGMRQTKQGA